MYKTLCKSTKEGSDLGLGRIGSTETPPPVFCWSLGASEHWEGSTPVVTDRTYEELGFRQGEWGSWSAVLLIE